MKKLWNRTRSLSRRGSEAQPATVDKKDIPPVPALPRTSQPVQRPATTIPPNRAVRPVLVGVSRDTNTSRPGTAGSFQAAVRRAADTTSQEFAGGNTKSKLPRYVDIFSVSSPSGSMSFTSSYNEEVAERNLDTRVTQADHQYYGYIPTSRYQEEVAMRNSYQSSDAPRSSHDRQHRSWISSGTESGPSKGNTPHTSWFHDNSRPNSHVPPTSNPQPLSPIRDSLESTSTAAVPPNSILANYNLSKSEVSQPHAIDQAQHPTRSSSRMSSTSNKINLQHRTIMDLTADEDHEATALELKTSRDMRPGPVQLVQAFSAASHQSVETATDTDMSPVTVQEITPITPLTPDGNVLRERVTKVTALPKSTSDFSTINTVASYSPRSTDAPAAAIPLAVEPVASIVPPSPDLAKKRLSTVTQNDATAEKNTLPPAEAINEIVPNGTADEGALEPPASSTSPFTYHTLTTLTPLQAAKNIHSSPESLQSVDFTNPSAAFGVRARDFAVQPSKSALKSERGANTSAKVSRANATNIETEPAPTENDRSLSPYTFDEEAFKRKQEQARAALIKLQASLNEEFIPPPRTQSAPRPNRMNNLGQRRMPGGRDVTDPHGPVAPSSIFQTTNGPDDGRGRSRPNGIQTQSRPKAAAGEGVASSASVVTMRAVGRSARQPLQQSQSYTIPPRTHVLSEQFQGKGKARDIDIALFDLQRTAEEITGIPPPRVSSAQPRPPRSPLRERKAAPNGHGLFGYGFGQPDLANDVSQKVQTPTSPGEVSLSNFPLAPSPTQLQRESFSRGNSGYASHHAHARDSSVNSNDPFVENKIKNATSSATTNLPPFAPGASSVKRRPSITSQSSHMTSTSQYSIPFHMIPERGSSMRDSLVQEVDAVGGRDF